MVVGLTSSTTPHSSFSIEPTPRHDRARRERAPRGIRGGRGGARPVNQFETLYQHAVDNYGLVSTAEAARVGIHRKEFPG